MFPVDCVILPVSLASYQSVIPVLNGRVGVGIYCMSSLSVAISPELFLKAA